MPSVTKSVDVEVPLSTAYNQWTQFESFPNFMGGVESVTQTDRSHSHWITNIGGVTREFDTEIIEQRPDERVAWRSTEGVEHSGVVTFEPRGPRETHVTVQLEWEPDSLMEKAGAVIGADDLQVMADLRRFKQFLEERGIEEGGWRGKIDPFDSDSF